MKVNILNSKMAYCRDTPEKLANALGISRQTLSAKLSGKSEFKQSEIDVIIKRYRLNSGEAYEIFFT